MAIVLAPIALWFFLSFVLTSRLYVRAGSVSTLVFGAIVQPLVCSVVFGFLVAQLGRYIHSESTIAIQPAIAVSLLFAVVIAVPMSLIVCVPLSRSIRTRQELGVSPPSDVCFEVVMIGGLSSVICAGLATLTVYLLIF